MDAATVTAVAALVAGPVAAAAAMYGQRGANRATQEGNAVNGFNSLTDQLQEERKELRADLAAVRIELAAEKLETARLRNLVQHLGGAP